MDETSGSCKERIMEDRHKIDQLTSTVAALKIERAQKKSDVDNLSNGLRERNSSLMVSGCGFILCHICLTEHAG